MISEYAAIPFLDFFPSVLPAGHSRRPPQQLTSLPGQSRQ
jgi:hypothetical protein